MVTDGLSGSFVLAPEDLSATHPMIVAHRLFAAHARDTDDAMVVVVR
jgi:hypothetical protein